MDKENSIIKSTEDFDVKEMIKGAKDLSEVLDNLNILEATFSNGDCYKNDVKNNIKIFAKTGLILEEKSNTYSFTIPKDDYNEMGVINDLEDKNIQEIIGTFIGRSQSSISVKKNSLLI